MSKRMRGSEASIFDTFGVDLDTGRVAAVENGKRKRGTWRRIVDAVSNWSPETKKNAMVGSAGVVIGGALAILAGRIGRPAVPKGAPPGTAPSPPHPARETAHAGASLVVKTPKGQAGVLRSAAGLKAPKVTEVPNGTAVGVLGTALAEKRRWYNVDAGNGRVGWMSGDILAVST